MPTPEVVAPAAGRPAVSPELVSRVDALAARIDQIAAEKIDWKPQVEKTAELLRARMEQLEEQLSCRRARSAAPTSFAANWQLSRSGSTRSRRRRDEWRLELAQVAENLRTRIERVEQSTARRPGRGAASVARRPGRASRLAARTVGGMARRGGRAREPDRRAACALRGVARADRRAAGRSFSRTRPRTMAGARSCRPSLEALVQRVDSLPAPSEEWRAEIEAIRRDLEQTPRQRARPCSGDLRSSLDALAARIESLPAPSEDWRGAVAELAARIEALPAPSEDWRAAVSELALPHRVASRAFGGVARTGRRSGRPRDSLPLDGWRTELAEVAENLRTRVERVEHGVTGASPPEELAELRSSLESLARTGRVAAGAGGGMA